MKKSLWAMVVVSVVAFFAVLPLTVHGIKSQFTLDFSMVAPQGDFKDNLDKTGFGLGVDYGIRFKNSPLIVGVGCHFTIYGSLDWSKYGFYAGEDRYNFLQLYLFTRIQPQQGRIRPYVEALAGFNYLYSLSTYESDYYYDTYDTVTKFEDTAWMYGIGGGFMYRLGHADKYQHGKKRVGSGPEFLLDFRVRYLLGGNVEYTNDDYCHIYKSKTSVAIFGVGIVFNF